MTSASSSASTTPMPLTPESTGGPSIGLSASNSSEGSTAPKKSRRQAAMLATHAGSPKPVKPFSRSAAKRESVLALGSIEHLQQYYTRTGMVNKKNPLFDKMKHQGLVPAIGGMPLSPTGDEIPGQADAFASIHAALSPQFSSSSSRPTPPIVVAPHIRTNEAHPDSLLPGVISELSDLVKAWAIDDPEPERTIDVLPLLRNTTRTIQTVRNYMVSLPDDSMISTQDKSADLLALIRRCSLQVLGTLRDLEETARLPLSDDAYDAQSDGGGTTSSGSRGTQSRGTSPLPPHPHDLPAEGEGQAQFYGDLGITFSLVQVHGRYEHVPVWEDEDADFPDDDLVKKEKREMWHQTLEVGNGWLYKQDLKLKDVEKERGTVKEYLDAVDDALFPSKEKEGEGKKERGWEIERRKLEIRTNRFASLISSGARSRSKRRVSSGEALDRGSAPAVQAASLLMDGAKRRVSTGMLGLMGASQRLTAEPEDMGGIKEEGVNEEEGEEGEEEGDELDHELEDDELPEWAKREAFDGDELDRAYAFLLRFLPPSHQHALVPPSPPLTPPDKPPAVQPGRTAFLASLTSGQLLCLAYNVCVRKSKHPWGFVSKEGIHDILALEKAAEEAGKPAGKTGWTFRRTDNLRLWVGALKLRYMLPITMPSQLMSALPPSLLKLPSVVSSASGKGSAPPSPRGKTNFGRTPSPIGQSKSTGAGAAAVNSSSPTSSEGTGKPVPDVILFDAGVVARRDEGWEDMLERVLLRWMWKAVGEKRKALPTPLG
ncbi:hypothetical protein DFP72DRAFT_904600 [Ephemerocybe angulata]|uniref:Uncharacterized protein n=1 Tax=Ephemerocybe angulata TaxID=980116 RepID=A0A8H6HT42_9AGAR|nr:hypothetical protein DFP72DRAFT_904600 [Tulosesus angulatus]